MASNYTEHLIMSPEEKGIMDGVAQEYKLTDEQKRLLYTIRKVENGGVGKEFGVLSPEAMRYKDNPVLSYLTQARWAAGTIKKRYDGDIEKFAKRWAPVGVANDPTNLNKNWIKNAQYYMNILKGE